MRKSTRVVIVALAGLALATVGCSSDPSSDSRDTAPVTAADQATDPATAETAAPDPGPAETTPTPPAGDAGDWPPADMCTVLSLESIEELTGETVNAATPNDGANAYGPYCDYLSDASGLFMTISSFTPEDWASYTASQVAQGNAVELPGLGDSAMIDADATLNDSTVYVTSGDRAYSVHVTSQTDNGWTPEITTQIATAVASAMLAG